jgi:hypothetical protein
VGVRAVSSIVKTNGSEFVHGDLALLGDEFANYAQVYPVNPVTLDNWLASEVDGIEAGVVVHEGTDGLDPATNPNVPGSYLTPKQGDPPVFGRLDWYVGYDNVAFVRIDFTAANWLYWNPVWGVRQVGGEGEWTVEYWNSTDSYVLLKVTNHGSVSSVSVDILGKNGETYDTATISTPPGDGPSVTPTMLGYGYRQPTAALVASDFTNDKATIRRSLGAALYYANGRRATAAAQGAWASANTALVAFEGATTGASCFVKPVPDPTTAAGPVNVTFTESQYGLGSLTIPVTTEAPIAEPPDWTFLYYGYTHAGLRYEQVASAMAAGTVGFAGPLVLTLGECTALEWTVFTQHGAWVSGPGVQNIVIADSSVVGLASDTTSWGRFGAAERVFGFHALGVGSTTITIEQLSMSSTVLFSQTITVTVNP